MEETGPAAAAAEGMRSAREALDTAVQFLEFIQFGNQSVDILKIINQ